MAIASTNEVKFLYAKAAANASKEVGVISFAEDTRQILVGTGAEAAVAFAGNVKNATFVEGVLTIERNSGDNLTLNFNDIASAKQTMAAFKSLDDAIKAEATARGKAVTTLSDDITNITKEGGTIDTKVAAEAKLRKDADDAITAKIGIVADGSTLVGMIADAKAAAIAAGTIVAEESDFITVKKSGVEGGTQTYTIKTTDIASATDLTGVSARVKANEDAITTLNGTGEGSVKKQVSDAIAGVVNTAPEAFDTLGEIASWIENDTTGAAAMSAQIAAHTTAIANNSTAIANLDASYKAADTAIRNEFAVADASVLKDAKAYSDAKTINGQSGHAITITSNDIKVGGTGNHKDASLSTSIEDLYTKVNKAQNAGVQSFAVASDSSAFAAVYENTGAVSFSVKTVALDGLTDSSANGLVDAKTVKAYVDAAESRATLKWQVA